MPFIIWQGDFVTAERMCARHRELVMCLVNSPEPTVLELLWVLSWTGLSYTPIRGVAIMGDTWAIHTYAWGAGIVASHFETWPRHTIVG